MNGVLKSLDYWLFHAFDDVPKKGLSAFRVIFCSYLLIVGIKRFASEIASQNQLLYAPKRSLAAFFDLPSNYFFVGLDYLFITLIILVLVGFKTRWTSLLLGLCFLVGNSFIYSFGKISHGWLLITLLPFVFSFSNWGAYYSIDSKMSQGNENTKEEHWPLAIFAGLICIAMFSAGLEKLYHGWLFFDTEKTRYVFFRGWLYERPGLLTEWVLTIKSGFFWAVADYSVVIFELGFLYAIWNANKFRLWIIFAVIFHLSIYLFMGFSFTFNLICYFVFINWNFVLYQLKLNKILDGVYSRIKYWHVGILVMIGVFLKWEYKKPYLLKIFKPDGEILVFSIFGIAIILALGSVFYYLRTRHSKAPS